MILVLISTLATLLLTERTSAAAPAAQPAPPSDFAAGGHPCETFVTYSEYSGTYYKDVFLNSSLLGYDPPTGTAVYRFYLHQYKSTGGDWVSWNRNSSYVCYGHEYPRPRQPDPTPTPTPSPTPTPPPPDWICDGRTISSADGMALLESVGYATFDAAEQQEARAGLCDVLALFDADTYEVVADAEPARAVVQVAGPGKLRGEFAAPGKIRSDGTVAACPVYTRQAVVRARKDVVDIPTGPFVWFQRHVLRRTEDQVRTTPPRMLEHDEIARLTVTVEACTAGGKFTNVTPPVGNEPIWRPYVSQTATVLGYSTPQDPQDSHHNYTDPPANTQLMSSARAVFQYGVDIGIVKVPENITKLSNVTLGVKLTLYSDGSWDAGVEEKQVGET